MRDQIPEEEVLGRITPAGQKTREAAGPASRPTSRRLGHGKGPRRIGGDVTVLGRQRSSDPGSEEAEVPEEEEAGGGGTRRRVSDGAVLWLCLRLEQLFLVF